MSPQGPLPQHAVARLGKGFLQDAAWSPSGQQYAVLTSLGTYIYDVQGTLVTFLPTSAMHIDFADENTLVALNKGRVAWWDVNKSQLLREQALPDVEPTVLAIYPGDGSVAVGLADGRVLLFPQGKEAPLLLAPVTGAAVSALAYSPKGTLLAVGYANGQVALWPSAGADVPKRLWDAHKGAVTALAFSPAGVNVLLATAGEDKVAHSWEINTGKKMVTFLGRAAGITHLAFTWQGDLLIGADSRGGILFWDAGNGILGQYLEKYHRGPILRMRLQPFGLLAVTVGRDGKLTLLHLATRQAAYTDDTYGIPVLSAFLFPQGDKVLYATQDNRLVLWAPEQNQILRELTGHKAPVHGLALSPDGQWLATADENGLILIWDTTTWFQVAHRFHQAGLFPMKHLAFTADKHYLVGAAWVTLYYWDMEKSSVYPEVTVPQQPALIHAMALQPETGQVALGLDDGRVLLWSLQEKGFTHTLNTGGLIVYDVAFHPKTNALLALTERQLFVWPRGSTQPKTYTLPLPSRVMRVLPDGRVLFAAHGWGVFDLASGQWAWLPPGHGTASITAIQVDRAGKRILTLAEDGSMLIWDAASLLP